jgi:hypothetical protein
MDVAATHGDGGRGSRRAPRSFWLLTAGGALGFWVTTFLTSLLPIAAEFRAAASIAYLPMVLVESPVGGAVIGGAVAYAMVHTRDRIPSVSPIGRSLLLAGVALAVATLIREAGAPPETDGDWAAFLTGTVLDLPRFLVLGTLIGYLYGRPRASTTDGPTT